jgi:PspAB-like protein
MGLLDALTGRTKIKAPAKDRLFAITTACVTLAAEHQIEPAGAAAIVFQPLATSEFEAALRDMEEVVKATGAETGTQVSTVDDAYGYRWMVLKAPDVEDLAVGINAVSSSIEMAGHGERLLCAVFAFVDAKRRPIYFIYNYKRGYWYPFVPQPGAGGDGKTGERDTERELRLRAQIANDLPIEPELERWFPLWGTPI